MALELSDAWTLATAILVAIALTLFLTGPVQERAFHWLKLVLRTLRRPASPPSAGRRRWERC